MGSVYHEGELDGRKVAGFDGSAQLVPLLRLPEHPEKLAQGCSSILRLKDKI
jgi:hypothetical protein